MHDPFRGYDQWKTASPWDEYGPEICEVCAKDDDDCECPECPVCGEMGNLHCIQNHGVKDTTVAGSIIALAENLSVESPWELYRALYKGSDCGISVGMYMWQNGEQGWVYGDDLPRKGEVKHHRPMGISICGYVEGSDVELESVEFTTPFDKDALYIAIANADKEAGYYWERDNHEHYLIMGPDTETYYAKIGPNEEFDENLAEDDREYISENIDDWNVGEEYKPIPHRTGWNIRKITCDEAY